MGDQFVKKNYLAVFTFLVFSNSFANVSYYTYGIDDSFSAINANESGYISASFSNFLNQSGLSPDTAVFDSIEVNKTRGVSFDFSDVNNQIIEAEIRLKARPLDDSKSEGNDQILLGLTDDIPFKYIALGIDGGSNPYFNFDWQIDSPTVLPPTPQELGYDITINLNSFNTIDAQNISIINDMNTFKALDFAITNDTAWDYIELQITTIPEPATVSFISLSYIGLILCRNKNKFFTSSNIHRHIASRHDFNILKWSVVSHSSASRIKRKKSLFRALC